MKITLEFDYPAERDLYQDSINGVHYRAVLQAVDEELRLWWKGTEDDAEMDFFGSIRALIRDELEARGLEL